MFQGKVYGTSGIFYFPAQLQVNGMDKREESASMPVLPLMGLIQLREGLNEGVSDSVWCLRTHKTYVRRRTGHYLGPQHQCTHASPRRHINLKNKMKLDSISHFKENSIRGW